MTETASSLDVVRKESGTFVLNNLSCVGVSRGPPATTVPDALTCGVLPVSDGTAWEPVSESASSSISVVSVPFDVTGEGPTMSLEGLMRCAECDLT